MRRDAPALLNAAPGGKMRAMAEALPEVNVTHPHQVFSATIADVLAGLVLANARETTWRFFLVHRGDEPFAAAEVAGDALSHVNEGPFVDGTASAMIKAEQYAASNEHNYEMRLLRIPALYTLAVWLTAPGDDVLIPAAPAPAPLVANEVYREESFTSALRPLAEIRNAADETSA
ncbi:MAG TPA: hypothetical protein VEO74_10815 [Thermoanaerobaculia bacterium]|nr:hypothetical protein [Thermoanaerobaculia bacterium]